MSSLSTKGCPRPDGPPCVNNLKTLPVSRERRGRLHADPDENGERHGAAPSGEAVRGVAHGLGRRRQLHPVLRHRRRDRRRGTWGALLQPHFLALGMVS